MSPAKKPNAAKPVRFSNRLVDTSITLGTSDHGILQPQVAVIGAGPAPARIVRAIGFMLCAELERATPAGEGWIVQLMDTTSGVIVYLELAHASAAEAARGLAVISKVVAEAL